MIANVNIFYRLAKYEFEQKNIYKLKELFGLKLNIFDTLGPGEPQGA